MRIIKILYYNKTHLQLMQMNQGREAKQMYIQSFGLTNFKSFRDSPMMEFRRGLNIVVGQNSAGKSALLEAIGLNQPWNPHKSPKSMTREGVAPPQHSKVEVSFSMDRDELLAMLLENSGVQFILPFPQYQTEFARHIHFSGESPADAQRLGDWFLSNDRYSISLTRHSYSASVTWAPTKLPSFGGYESAGEGPRYQGGIVYAFEPPERLQFRMFAASPINQDIGSQLVESIRSRIYVFRAERFKIGEHPIGNTSELAPDASNLPPVLNVLQGQKSRFERFNRVVRSILPQVPWISVRQAASSAQTSEIVIWPFGPDSERQDLVVPLRDCGTGVSQVLAIVYVLINFQRPSIIVIDEPQSFLHPGAARKLIEVLKDYPQHQYIIATHSPAIVSAADPVSVTVARLESGETSIEQMNQLDSRLQKALLADLGASLADVFGSDRILWVEGRTEEVCYSSIYRRQSTEGLVGTTILGVRHTGDLEGKLAERMIEIYNKLAVGNSLIPPSAGFLFDAECRSEQEKKDLIAKSGGLLHFIPKRMYENYLLVPAAIKSVINAISDFSPAQISEDDLSQALDAALCNSKYYCDNKIPESVPLRLQNCHGKKVLGEIFSTLSEKRVEYREVEHGSLLTDWLLTNAPSNLQEISTIITQVLTTHLTQSGTAQR